MIEPSPELVAVTRRWLHALQNKDRDALTNLFSRSEHLRYIGSDENEFWSGSLLRKGYADHIEEVPDFAIEPSIVEAFECGDAGWASCIGELHVKGTESRFVERFTLVFVLEQGSWKIAQAHSSFPRSNLETIGVEHSAFDRLIESARAHFEPAASEGTTTVMFTDIVNSSSIGNLVGDRVWASTVNWHIDSLTGVIEDNGGSIVKSLGDGTMSTFSSARGAMSAAIAIQRLNRNSRREPRFQIRIGVHTGDVIQTKGDFFGNVVNKAARIASVAEPGQILVSDATRVMVAGHGDFRFGDAAPVMLKGIEGTHVISTLEWA